MTEVLPSTDLFGNRVEQPAPRGPSLAEVFDAWARAARSPLKPRERAALGRATRTLLADGVPMRIIVETARLMAAEGKFPGALPATVRSMPVPCVNGASRSRLTKEQLSRCSCQGCMRWFGLRQENPLPFDP